MLNAQYSVDAVPTASPESLEDALVAFGDGETIPEVKLQALEDFGMVELIDNFYMLTDDGEEILA